MRALAGGWGASPRGLDAVTWASAGGCAARHRRVAGVARILAVPPGWRRAAARPRRSRRDPGRAAGGGACTLTGGRRSRQVPQKRSHSVLLPLSYQANAFM